MGTRSTSCLPDGRFHRFADRSSAAANNTLVLVREESRFRGARFERAKHGRGEFCWKSGTRRASSAKTRVVSRYESAVGRPKV
jgi:hypothetical protein